MVDPEQQVQLQIIDTEIPLDVPLAAKYKRCFAYDTVKDRLPVILTQIIDQLSRDKELLVQEHGASAKEELKDVIGRLSKLKNEMQTNKPFEKLTSTKVDANFWNSYIDTHIQSTGGIIPTWFESPWLYVECYMYRRVSEAFELSPSLATFDYFRKQKEEAVMLSAEAMRVHATHLLSVLEKIKDTAPSELKEAFRILLEMNLWGNKCDLSISGGKENSQTNNPLDQLETLKEYILANDSDNAWDLLKDRGNKNEVILDIVLDNGGYELFTDFCLADFLCSAGLVDNVRFYVKMVPWFVSDTMSADINWTLDTLVNASKTLNDKVSTTEGLQTVGERWQKYISDGKWSVVETYFWTYPCDYSSLKSINRDLYDKLGEAKLIIFKGDLNYRKLVGDLNWETTTSFTKALRGFKPTKVFAIRTIKSDPVVGLKAGQAKDIRKKSENWLRSGEYALMQLSE